MSLQILDHGRIREIRLARPPANALDRTLCQTLTAAIQQAVKAADGIVLSGSERIFSGGMDVPFLLALGEDRTALQASWMAFFAAAQALAACPVPVAAALTGHAPAGGCLLALCCDYRIMARSTDPKKPYTIGLNEVPVGLPVPEGVQRLLRRILGAHRAERLLIAGELLPAEQAVQLGLVDELAEGEQVTARAVAWLQALLQLPRQPMLATRAIARADLRAALVPELIQLERFLDAWYTHDAQTALHRLAVHLQKH